MRHAQDNKPSHRCLITYTTAVCLGLHVAASVRHAGAQSTGIIVEAVTEYTTPGCASGNVPNAVADGTNFMNAMTAANPGFFTNSGLYTNGDVWTSDFYDPDRTSLADDDTTYFDASHVISYYAGHGVSGSGDTTVACTQSRTCDSPPAGSMLPGFCRRYPGDNFGTCSYNKLNRRLVVGNCNAGPNPGGSGRWGMIEYSTGNVKWGESTNSGGWGGAGTNGGTNMVILHASLAQMSNRPLEILPAMAGVHILATTVVHTGDTTVVANKGSSMAARFAANPNGQPGHDWLEALNSSTGGSNCKNKAGTTVYGGGHGFNGCGAHDRLAAGQTSGDALGHALETYAQMKNDANDAISSTWLAQAKMCNYDCFAWPYALPW